MAGRHRWNAAASGIDMMTMLMLDQREHERNLRDKALELHQKFQYDAQLRSIETGGSRWNPTTQQVEPMQPFDVGSLAEGASFSRPYMGGTLSQKSALDVEKEKRSIDQENQRILMEQEKIRQDAEKEKLARPKALADLAHVQAETSQLNEKTAIAKQGGLKHWLVGDPNPLTPTALRKPGGVLHQDKYGTRAYIYPDGTVEEIP